MYCSLPEVSKSRASVMGRVTSLEKNAICCAWPSSMILKSSCLRSVTMRLLLSRTVTNRFTRLTFVRITGPCCDVSWARAATAHPMATAAAEQTARIFFPERMYTFLVEVTPPKYRKLGYLLPVRMRRSAVRDVRPGRQSCPKPKKVWPEEHEKSTKNAPDCSALRFWIRSVPCGAKHAATCIVGRNTKRGASTGPSRPRRAAKRSAIQDQREFQPGDPAGHGEGSLRQSSSRFAPR